MDEKDVETVDVGVLEAVPLLLGVLLGVLEGVGVFVGVCVELGVAEQLMPVAA